MNYRGLQEKIGGWGISSGLGANSLAREPASVRGPCGLMNFVVYSNAIRVVHSLGEFLVVLRSYCWAS